MTVGQEDHTNRLVEGRKAADQRETMGVTNETREQIAKRLSTDYGQIEKLVRIAATEGVEAALELLDGTQEEDDEAHRAALRALDDDDWRDRE